MALDIAGFDANIATYGVTHRDFFLTTPYNDPALAAYYYDAARVFYQIGDYLNNADSASYYAAAARAATVIYRDGYLVPASFVAPGYWIFSQGLRMHWQRTGDEASRQAVINLSLYGSFAPDWVNDATFLADANAITTVGGSREAAYVFMSYLDAEICGAARRPRTTTLVNIMLGHLDQWATGLAYTYVRPFMVAITGEALIRAVGAGLVSADTVRTKLATVFTYLNLNTWDDPNNCYLYTDRIGTNPPDAWASTEDGLPAYDLGIMISSVLQWMGGTWVTRAEEQFNSGVSGSWLVNGKQFMQSYRMAFNQFDWLDQQQGGGETSPPEGNTESRVSSSSICLPLGWIRGYATPSRTSVSGDGGGNPVPPDPEPEPPTEFPFNPADYGTVSWDMDATIAANVQDAGGLPCDDGEACATFLDNGPNDYHLPTQATAGYRPVCRKAFLTSPQDTQVLEFDGGDGWGWDLAEAGALTKDKAGLTFAFAFRHTDFSAAARIFNVQAGAAAASRIYIGFTSPSHQLFVNVRPQDGGASDQEYGSLTYLPTLNQWHIYVIKFDFAGNAMKAWLDTDVTIDSNDITSTGNTSNTNPSGADSSQFGFNYYGAAGITGQLGQFVIWDSALDDAVCQTITTDMGSKFGLSLLAP